MIRKDLFFLVLLIMCTVVVSLYILRMKGADISESKCSALLEKLVSNTAKQQQQQQAPACDCRSHATQVKFYEDLVKHLQAEVAALRQQSQAHGTVNGTLAALTCPPATCSPCTTTDSECPACPAQTPCPACPAGAGPVGCKELKDRNSLLDNKVNQVFTIVKTYMVRYQELLQKVEDITIETAETLAQAKGESPVSYYRNRTRPINVAILTPQEGPVSQMTRMSAYTKERYCALHGYDFIWDTSAYAANHTRHATWNRVPSLQKHLPKYDWILYMDSDISIANASILLEDFIYRFPNDTRIAFTDGLEGFNAGAFFIKNDPWSFWLLKAWWDASESDPGKQCTASKDDVIKFHRCKYQWNDQVALWDVMLPYYAEKGKKGKKVTCKTSPSVDWLSSINCYRDTMLQLGRPYGKRSAYHFYFWPLEGDPRGWTFFQLDRRGLSVWPENELFHPMDFALHSHDEKAVLKFSIYRQMMAREERQRKKQPK